MLHAFIIVCASSISFEVDTASCFIVNDTWGPYKTEENCEIRANQMKDEVLYGEFNEYVFAILGDPELIYAEPHCEPVIMDPEA